MCDTAAHLVDNVFPEVPVRQWVVTFPFNLRYLFAYNKKAITKALEVVIRAINRHYIVKGRLEGVGKGRSGSVTLIQRFGSSLNLNVHFHILFADGVWDDKGRFYRARWISDEEVSSVLGKIKERVIGCLERGGFIDDNHISDTDELQLDFPGLAFSNSCSIKRVDSQGQKVEQLGQKYDLAWRPNEGKLCKYDDGFSLHAATAVGAFERERLERLLVCSTS
jgi:hypothetical protein